MYFYFVNVGMPKVCILSKIGYVLGMYFLNTCIPALYKTNLALPYQIKTWENFQSKPPPKFLRVGFRFLH